MCATRDAASSWERDWEEHVNKLECQLRLSSKNLFRREVHRDSGVTHGDDFVVHGADRLACRLEEQKLLQCAQSKNHQLRVNREH